MFAPHVQPDHGSEHCQASHQRLHPSMHTYGRPGACLLVVLSERPPKADSRLERGKAGKEWRWGMEGIVGMDSVITSWFSGMAGGAVYCRGGPCMSSRTCSHRRMVAHMVSRCGSCRTYQGTHVVSLEAAQSASAPARHTVRLWS